MLSDTLTNRVVVIGDVVASRGVPDRAHLDAALADALALASRVAEAEEPLAPTVGDEFQGVFPALPAAVGATLLVRVSLPAPYDVRFGIGVGPVTWAEPGPASGTDGRARRQDGPAWWAARDAIDHVARAGRGRAVPATSRTWIAGAGKPDGAPPAAADDLVRALNAHLALRDHLVTRMDARDRRIVQRLLLGRAITDIAAEEGVTASAVSQRVQRSGAAEIVYAMEQMAYLRGV